MNKINEFLKAEFIEKFTEYKRFVALHGGKSEYCVAVDRGTCFGKVLEIQIIAYSIGNKQLQEFIQSELDNYYKSI